MLHEWNIRWKVGRQRKHLLIRWSFANPFKAIWRILCGRWWMGDIPNFELYHHAHSQDECYCPEGSETKFRLGLFGSSCGVWLSRSWTTRPCHCDKVIWLLFPDLHVEEIEDYGLARLQAEYPGIKAAH